MLSPLSIRQALLSQHHINVNEMGDAIEAYVMISSEINCRKILWSYYIRPVRQMLILCASPIMYLVHTCSYIVICMDSANNCNLSSL